MRLQSKALLVLLAWAASGPALATEYYYCYVRDYNGNQLRYYSDIMSTAGEIDEQETGFAYGEEIKALLQRDYPGDGGSMQTCSASSNLAYLKKQWTNLPRTWPGPNPRKVPFTHPPVPSTPVVDNAPGPYLSIEERKPIGPSPEQLAAQAQAQRQADAAKSAERARTAAATAQADPTWQALLERERERRRKCPSCQ